MALFKNKFRVESARLKNWDYRRSAVYFITICTRNRVCFFGDCTNGEMHLNENSILADKFWLEIPRHFSHVKLGAHIIMPNHLHGILILGNELNDNTVGAIVPTDPINNEFMSSISPKSGSVSTIIRSYKSACTKEINMEFPEIQFGWQPRFHDHIVRNEEEYRRIEQYIINNPGNWSSDKFHLNE